MLDFEKSKSRKVDWEYVECRKVEKSKSRKATLLALRDGREAFWESAILPQLLEPWLGPKSHATVVLLSPVRYSSDMHQEAHEWLTFTRLAQEAYSGNPLPYSQLQKNWSGKVQNALSLPASFQEPGVVELKEEAKKEEPPAAATALAAPAAPPTALEQQSHVSQVSQASLDYHMLPSETSLCHSQLPSQSVVSQASVPSQPSSERREECQQSTAPTSMENEAQKASAASQASGRDSKPGDWSPEGPRVRAEVSAQQLALATPPGSGRKLVKALSPMASQAQYTSGMVTPPPPANMKPVSPLQGARSPIAAAIEGVVTGVPLEVFAEGLQARKAARRLVKAEETDEERCKHTKMLCEGAFRSMRDCYLADCREQTQRCNRLRDLMDECQRLGEQSMVGRLLKCEGNGSWCESGSPGLPCGQCVPLAMQTAEVLRDGGERVTQVHSVKPPGSPERPMLNGAMPPVQAMPPPRHLSPLRQILTKQVSVVPPSTSPGGTGSAAEPTNLAGPGRMAPAPAPAAPAPAVAAPATTS
eukprot:s643_g8.t2